MTVDVNKLTIQLDKDEIFLLNSILAFSLEFDMKYNNLTTCERKMAETLYKLTDNSHNDVEFFEEE